MSTVDRYWSFKLLLQGQRDAHEDVDENVEEDIHEDDRDRSQMGHVFFVNGAQGQSSHPADGSNVLTDEYAQFEAPSIDIAEPEPMDVSQPPSPALPDIDFVLPTEKELKRLSVVELRKLRREIALQVHPDRVGAKAIDDGAMGRCNQMIDAAIKAKLAGRS